MRWFLGGLGVLVLFWVMRFVLRMRRVGRKYDRAFSSAHYVEFAELLHRIRDEAEKERYTGEQEDLPHGITSADIVLSYSIANEESAYRHHLSMSLHGGYLARWLGGPLFCYACDLLDVRTAIEVWVGKSEVFHLDFLADEPAHQAILTARPPKNVEEAVERFDLARQRSPEMVEQLATNEPPEMPETT